MSSETRRGVAETLRDEPARDHALAGTYGIIRVVYHPADAADAEKLALLRSATADL